MKRIVLFVIASIAIFEARLEAVPFMLLAALLAVLVSTRLPSQTTAPLHPLRLLRFAPWFFWQSAQAGLDVAVRAFRGSAGLQAGFVEYRTRIRNPTARVAFVNAVSLMPGSLTAQLDGADMLVHTLDTRADVAARLRQVEDHLAHLFGEGDA